MCILPFRVGFLRSLIIDNCVKSLGILSRETVIANHPWVDDVEGELKGVLSG